MNKVVVIAFFFPPTGGAGSQRPQKLCKYFPKENWELTIITRGENQDRNKENPIDDSLEKEIRSLNIKIITVSCSDPLEFSKKIKHRLSGFDLVFITMPPYSLVNLVEVVTKTTKSKIVLDLRDPWVLDGWYKTPSWIHWKKSFNKTKNILIGVDAVIFNTPEVKKEYVKLIPELEKNSIYITNGFDEKDFSFITYNTRKKEVNNIIIAHNGYNSCNFFYRSLWQKIKDILKFSYRNTLYGGRSVYYLIKALYILKTKNVAIYKRVKLKLIGMYDDGVKKTIKKYGVESSIELCGYMQHVDSLVEMSKADALFLPLHGLKKTTRSFIVPGKLYEYLFMKKPIIAALPEGDARDFINNANLGYFSNPTDAKNIALVIQRLVFDIDNNKKIEPDNEFISFFSRQNIAERICLVFEALLNGDFSGKIHDIENYISSPNGSCQ